MSDYLAIVDAGNGMTNAILRKTNGKSYKTHHFPSVRARATGDSLGLGEQFEMSVQYADWLGHRYIWGDEVTRITQRHLETHRGVDRYGNEFHQFLTAVGLAELGLKKGEVALTLFAPPGIYESAKDNIKEGFLERDGMAKLRLKDDKKPREWKYTAVNVFPEGLGAIACFAFDDNGNMVENDILDGSVALVDLGLFTTDVVITIDGMFNPENLDRSTYRNAGVDEYIRKPVLRALHNIDEDFSVLTEEHVDLAIRKGLASGDYTLKVAGKEADIENVVNENRRRYAEWLANRIFETDYQGFRGSKLMLVGGGSLFVREYLQEWYGDKIIDPQQLPHTKNIHPAYFNAMGGMRLAVAQLKQSS